jgi:hypothetical protein
MTPERHFRLLTILLFVLVAFLPAQGQEAPLGGKLKGVVPGQPVCSLIPIGPARFQIEGAPAGSFIQFEMDDGRVKNPIFIQGPTDFVFRPKQ